MKPKKQYNGMGVFGGFGAIILAGSIFCAGSVQAAPIIDLSQPVADSVETITGISWRFNSVDGTTTPDSSGNNYTGNLDANGTGGTLPSLTTGVDLPDTSGYEDGLIFTPNPNGNNSSRGNSRVYAVLPVTNNLGMAATDFTGGAWLQFDSILSGLNQTVVIMDRGGMNTTNGHWTFFLSKNTADNWQIGFQTGNASSFVTGYNSATALNLNLQDGAWHHLGFTYDYVDGVANNVVTFWLDGEEVGFASLAGNIASGATDATTRRFSVGERATGSYLSVFDGNMDDLFATTGLYEFAPVPEPTALALAGFAGAFLAIARRQRPVRV